MKGMKVVRSKNIIKDQTKDNQIHITIAMVQDNKDIKDKDKDKEEEEEEEEIEEVVGSSKCLQE